MGGGLGQLETVLYQIWGPLRALNFKFHPTAWSGNHKQEPEVREDPGEGSLPGGQEERWSSPGALGTRVEWVSLAAQSLCEDLLAYLV